MDTTWTERMRDTDNPSAITANWAGAVAGYLPVGDPAGPWQPADWARFVGRRKLPIVEASDLAIYDPADLARQALQQLRLLGVPHGKYTALAIETQDQPDWVEAYGDYMHLAGYKTWLCGSASVVFNNPQLNGWWVEDWAEQGPFMYDHPGVRATQYASPQTGSGGDWDSSTILDWVYYSDSWWR